MDILIDNGMKNSKSAGRKIWQIIFRSLCAIWSCAIPLALCYLVVRCMFLDYMMYKNIVAPIWELTSKDLVIGKFIDAYNKRVIDSAGNDHFGMGKFLERELPPDYLLTVHAIYAAFVSMTSKFG